MTDTVNQSFQDIVDNDIWTAVAAGNMDQVIAAMDRAREAFQTEYPDRIFNANSVMQEVGASIAFHGQFAIAWAQFNRQRQREQQQENQEA